MVNDKGNSSLLVKKFEKNRNLGIHEIWFFGVLCLNYSRHSLPVRIEVEKLHRGTLPIFSHLFVGR